MRRQERECAGTVLICVLACLLVVTGLAVAMVKSALIARKAVRTERQHAQVQFLLEAGAQRAADQLTRDDSYRGETWELPAGALSDSSPARVDIEISTADDDSSLRVSVMAQLPADSPWSVRRSHTFTISNEE
jgi:type II secretory pathway component PulK